MTEVKNVSKKLLNAIKQVGGKVQKTGYNTYSKYKYITESDINEAVLPALMDNGLVLTTSVDSYEETPSSTDNKNRFATVKLTHTIIDTDSGESLIFSSVGTGADTLDKAIYKSLTGACKYMMMKLFMISGDSADPENDGVTAPVQQPSAKAAFGKPQQQAAPAVKPAQQGFLAKKTETAAPALTQGGAKKPTFGKSAAPAQEPVEQPAQEVTEEDAAF